MNAGLDADQPTRANPEQIKEDAARLRELNTEVGMTAEERQAVTRTTDLLDSLTEEEHPTITAADESNPRVRYVTPWTNKEDARLDQAARDLSICLCGIGEGGDCPKHPTNKEEE